MQNWKLSWNTLGTQCIHGGFFCRYVTNLYAQSVLSNKMPAPELTREFIKGASSLVGVSSPNNGEKCDWTLRTYACTPLMVSGKQDVVYVVCSTWGLLFSLSLSFPGVTSRKMERAPESFTFLVSTSSCLTPR